jgi:hypothetical protein
MRRQKLLGIIIGIQDRNTSMEKGLSSIFCGHLKDTRMGQKAVFRPENARLR